MHAPTLAQLSAADQTRRVTSSPQFQSGIFVNSIATPMTSPGALSTIMAEYMRTPGRLKKPPAPIPSDNIDPAWLNRTADDIRVTWLGHSTTILEVDGARVLTDPVWGRRASPFSFAGPMRFHDPLLALDSLPRLDAILLSHDHYDHLCLDTMRVLARDTTLPVITTMRVGARLLAAGFPPDRITELDWWESTMIGDTGVELVCTPARHFSGRSLSDRFSTLWCSWSIIGPSHRLYFSADSGPTPDHAEIGRRLGPFDMTLFEVGAYHPAWGNVHLGPEGALNAHRDVGGRVFMPIHWATFDLGLHTWSDPVDRLMEMANSVGHPVVTPRLGQTITPDTSTEPWWQTL